MHSKPLYDEKEDLELMRSKSGNREAACQYCREKVDSYLKVAEYAVLFVAGKSQLMYLRSGGKRFTRGSAKYGKHLSLIHI